MLPSLKSSQRNQFINDEVVEATEVENEDSQAGESSNADCQVLAVFTQEEENAIEDLEHLIDMNIWFSDDEFVNTIKNTKRRHLLLDSDSEWPFIPFASLRFGTRVVLCYPALISQIILAEELCYAFVPLCLVVF